MPSPTATKKLFRIFLRLCGAAAAGQKTIYFTMVATGLMERNVPAAGQKIIYFTMVATGLMERNVPAAGQKIIFFATVAAATVKRNASKKYKILHCRPGAAGRNRALGNYSKYFILFGG